MLADSHCHLDWFREPESVVQRAVKSGVSAILSNSTSPENIGPNLELSKKFKEVGCAIGLHPVDLLSLGEAQIMAAVKLVESRVHEAAAVGEIGMDFKHANAAQKKLQERVFRGFVAIAIGAKKPVVVHARFAEPECLDILEELGAKKVHLHWFTNFHENAQKAVELGYFISCGPIIFSDPASAEVVKGIPLESLLLETDAPVFFKGKQSEPSWIPEVCAKVAQLHGVENSVAESKTGKNFTKLYFKE